MSQKKVVIITGASSGIGREFAYQYSKKHDADEIWLVARRKKELEQLAKKITIPCVCIEGDLQQEKIWNELREKLQQENPNILLLFNGAGFGKIGKVEENQAKDLEGMCRLNIVALTILCQMVIPYMKEQGKIVNMASAAAFTPQPKFAVYAASKSYVFSLSRALNCELRDRKITVTAVCPGPVKTNFFEVAQEGQNSPWYKKFFYVDCKKMVAYTIKDVEKGKTISIYSIPMKGLYIVSKIIPHRIIMKFV